MQQGSDTPSELQLGEPGEGPATGLDDDLYSSDGTAWCRFGAGSTECMNGKACRNLNHVEDKDPWTVINNVKRDRWGRPLLPDPYTGKERAWTRVTTAAKALDSPDALIDWKARMVAYGVGQREDLQELAASADGSDDRQVLKDVVEQAVVVAQAGKKANAGTALHGITAKIDRGDADVVIPARHRERLARYEALVKAYGFTMLPDMMERLVCVPELGLAGSMDRGIEWRGRLICGDLKTGSLDYSKVAIAQQLAAYAHGTHYWGEDNQWHEQEPLDKETALVIWLPAYADDQPKVYSVDIAEGWNLLQMSVDLRGIRSTKGSALFEEVDVVEADTPPLAVVEEAALRDRVTKIIEAGHVAQLKGLWDPSVPTLKEGGLNLQQRMLVQSWCEQVEADNQMSF